MHCRVTRVGQNSFYMSRSFAESVLLIGLTLLSIQQNLHRYPQCQFASSAATPFNSQGSIFGPPPLAKIPPFMYKIFVKSAVLIGLMLPAIDCDLHRHSQRPFATTAATPLALKEASSGHRQWPKYLSICIKASQNAPY
jgi:hypothetical protein